MTNTELIKKEITLLLEAAPEMDAGQRWQVMERIERLRRRLRELEATNK